MRTWTSLIITMAAAASVTAYAQQDKETQERTRENTTTLGTAGAGTDETRAGKGVQDARGATATSTTGARGEKEAKPGTMDRQGASSSTLAMQNDPELKNLTNEKFVQKAAAAGMKEVQAAEVALKNSKDEEVRSFAREMIQDHTKANQQLTTLAQQNNVQVPKELPAKEKADVDKLRAQTGSEFDKAYKQQMQMDHQRAVALHQSCATANQLDAAFKQYCNAQLPTLKEHRQDAQAMEAKMDKTRSAAADE